jgi:hypothetical protein
VAVAALTTELFVIVVILVALHRRGIRVFHVRPDVDGQGAGA